MARVKMKSQVGKRVREFLTADFRPQFGELSDQFETKQLWRRMRELGTRLWLDTGSIEDIATHWTREFSAVTVNNTLLNKVVQTGRYDSLITQAAELLDEFPELSEHDRMLEMNFILNGFHGLRLIEQFDACVSLEEHTDLADDLEGSLEYARRYHALCPERIYVKIPLSPAGLLACRTLSAEGVKINNTLGFSARQNYMMARMGNPAFVNVFLGRLNSFIEQNELGAGEYVGERATLAAQAAVRQLRAYGKTGSLQIGASLRAAQQVADLAGVDVLTMPPKVAGEFLEMNMPGEDIDDRTAARYEPGISDSEQAKAIRTAVLWDIDEKLVDCVEAALREHLPSFTPDDLVEFFRMHGCRDLMVNWSPRQRQTSMEEGKIPRLENWADALKAGEIALDALMNLAGLSSFAADQQQTDQRIREVMKKRDAERKRD